MEAALRRNSHIPLLLSGELMEPGIFGLFRPVLIWPERLSERLDDEHIEAILAHELMHVRRRDNLTAALHMLVEAAFWFHPLVWWMEWRMVEERERACDEAVVERGGQPGIYAESLLKAVRFCVESPLVCVAGITGADLSRRVRAIMTERSMPKLGFGKKISLVAVGLVVIAVPIVLGQVKSAQRMMVAALASAPSPFRTAAHAMIEREQTPPTGLPAEVQGATEVPSDANTFAFDVVSIRPADPNDHGRHGSQFTDDGFVVESQSLEMMLMLQYPELQPYSSRIVGGGDWVRTLTWDIRAKVADSDISAWSKLNHDSSASAKKRHNATIRALLTDRFKLKTHFETREGTVYALVVGKDGPKLKPSTSDALARFTMHGQGHISFERMTVGSIMPFFAQELGHPVIDKTGLTGKYDMTLDWTPTQGAAAASGGDAAEASDSAAPSLFTAVQEQLGLKLEAQKGPIVTLVIDSAEKPSVDGDEVPNPKQEPAVGPPGPNATKVVPMAADAHPAFAVAAIKPHDPSSNHQGFNATGDRFIIRNEGIVSLMMFAYSIDKHQLVGLPDWVDNAPYDIEGTTDTPGEPNLRQQQEMIRKLLADRFQLKFHPEKRDLSAYAIQVAKGGPKLKPPANPDAQPNQDAKSHGAEVTVNVTSASIPDFIMGMQFFLDRPLVDQTGLTGHYDFSVRYTYNDAYSTDPNAPPGIATAFQEQLGLKLQAIKAHANVFVIDHIEQPSPN